VDQSDHSLETVIKVRWYPKDKALEMCARSLGMLKDAMHLTVSDETLSRLDEWKAANLRARPPADTDAATEKNMATSHPRGHRPTDSPDTFTRERWEQEVRCLDPQLFDETAKGRRTFTLRELRAMPEAMQRAIRSVKVRTVKDSSDGTTDQVVDVKLWGKARALKLAARAEMHALGSPRK
jgi:hypothetical protein